MIPIDLLNLKLQKPGKGGGSGFSGRLAAIIIGVLAVWGIQLCAKSTTAGTVIGLLLIFGALGILLITLKRKPPKSWLEDEPEAAKPETACDHPERNRNFERRVGMTTNDLRDPKFQRPKKSGETDFPGGLAVFISVFFGLVGFGVCTQGSATGIIVGLLLIFAALGVLLATLKRKAPENWLEELSNSDWIKAKNRGSFLKWLEDGPAAADHQSPGAADSKNDEGGENAKAKRTRFFDAPVSEEKAACDNPEPHRHFDAAPKEAYRAPAINTPDQIAGRLRNRKELYQAGLLTREEYDAEVRKIRRG